MIGTYLLPSLDVLDGVEIPGLFIPHQSRNAEISRADIFNKLVPISIVHYRHIHPRSNSHRSSIHLQRSNLVLSLRHIPRRPNTQESLESEKRRGGRKNRPMASKKVGVVGWTIRTLAQQERNRTPEVIRS